ncbi:redoxin domain-containing protein [Psychroserpens mesophilus]|uniref:redoxin domain-containing protein n=1 Tax=Psychroserpens mesophilus TaxID=325473 RepID=UPI003F4931E2
MKLTCYSIIIFVLLISCKEDKKTEFIEVNQDHYTIQGSAPGLFNGLRAYLKSTDEKGFLKSQDTAIIMNEAFTFEGNVDHSEVWFLEINSLDGSLPFVIDNVNLSFEINKDDIKQSVIKGNQVNNTINEFNIQLKKLEDSLSHTSERYRQMILNKENVTGMSDKVEHLKEVILKFPHEFIQNNTDNPYGLVLLNNMIRRSASDKGFIVESYDAINEDLKTSNLGKRVAKSIPNIRIQYAIIAATDIGRVAPNFSAPDPNGNIIELNKIRGKATLVHFWSSWYKASRRDNARLVKLYDKYHDQGLEMIGVSLDGNTNQTHPKSDWKQAIKEDKLIWSQISNLKYFNDSISNAYNVRSLPASFLLDSEGVIVGKNLQGNTLEDKLKALLK